MQKKRETHREIYGKSIQNPRPKMEVFFMDFNHRMFQVSILPSHAITIVLPEVDHLDFVLVETSGKRFDTRNRGFLVIVMSYHLVAGMTHGLSQ